MDVYAVLKKMKCLRSNRAYKHSDAEALRKFLDPSLDA
jgi:hypothetical protein